jgi:hypothetical protein
MPQSIRSILAVIAGYLAMAIVVVILTMLCVAIFHLQSGHPTPVYLALNMAYSLAAAALGGWITARIAGRSPIAHGIALGAVILALSALQFLHPAPGQSFAYLIFLAIAPPLAAVAGAAFYGRSH